MLAAFGDHGNAGLTSSSRSTGLPRPGISAGPTSEFSLFFRVKRGEGEPLRDALRTLQETPGYRPGDYGIALATIHEARFVLFDDDTRLAFMTSFDGPWDAYMEDFFTSGPTLAHLLRPCIYLLGSFGLNAHPSSVTGWRLLAGSQVMSTSPWPCTRAT